AARMRGTALITVEDNLPPGGEQGTHEPVRAPHAQRPGREAEAAVVRWGRGALEGRVMMVVRGEGEGVIAHARNAARALVCLFVPRSVVARLSRREFEHAAERVA